MAIKLIRGHCIGYEGSLIINTNVKYRMNGFKVISGNGQEIRFEYYRQDAPVTSGAFHQALPFTTTFYHARVSGEEIWIDNAPVLPIIQENASVFVAPGEVVIGPDQPRRVKTAGCFGIYYGEGKGLDAANIFAKVMDEDFEKLQDLGRDIWTNGAQELTVTSLSADW